jgi:hypothetical protein
MIPTGAGTKKDPPSGSLRYPKNVNYASYMDYVSFTFYKYRSPFSKEASAAAGSGGIYTASGYNASVSAAALGTSTGNIILYMPEDISADYGASWQDMNLSNMAKGALQSTGSAFGGDIGGSIGAMVTAIGNASKNAITSGTLFSNVVSQALNDSNFGSFTVNDVFAATSQQILNPNTEVLYKGPKMRNFSLSFKLVPRDSGEAIEIKNIIHMFKYATLPQVGSNGDNTKASFVGIPQICDVTFKTGGSVNPWVSQFKPSVITGFSVSYTPDGAWSTAGSSGDAGYGSPVATSIKIDFQETKMVYADETSASGATY